MFERTANLLFDKVLVIDNEVLKKELMTLRHIQQCYYTSSILGTPSKTNFMFEHQKAQPW